MAGRRGMWSRSRWRRLAVARELLERGAVPPHPVLLARALGVCRMTASRYLRALGYPGWAPREFERLMRTGGDE